MTEVAGTVFAVVAFVVFLVPTTVKNAIFRIIVLACRFVESVKACTTFQAVRPFEAVLTFCTLKVVGHTSVYLALQYNTSWYLVDRVALVYHAHDLRLRVVLLQEVVYSAALACGAAGVV